MSTPLVIIKNESWIRFWKIQFLQPNDTSKGAFVFLALKLRNEIKPWNYERYSRFKYISTLYWQCIKKFLVGLYYKDMVDINLLETFPLDKHIFKTHVKIGSLFLHFLQVIFSIDFQLVRDNTVEKSITRYAR